MSQDQEWEIRLQFLEEAQEYLNTIESGLLGLSSEGINAQRMDGVLRAAHSVKGGAAMMGFSQLSELAHRLEDSFKVLKIRRSSLHVDPELESLLLAASDRLRQVSVMNRQSFEIDEHWIATEATPLFEQLYQILGDPKEGEETQLVAEETGQGMQDMVNMIFETEVEGCLQRLEKIMATPGQPCLREELSIMAQEMDGLGVMLQLPAFSSLCQSVVKEVEAAPADRVSAIADESLQSWRRTQALVMVGQVDLLPSQLSVSAASAPAITPPPVESDLLDLFGSDLPDFAALTDAELPELSFTESSDSFADVASAPAADESALMDFLGGSSPVAESQESALIDLLGDFELPSDLDLGQLTPPDEEPQPEAPLAITPVPAPLTPEPVIVPSSVQPTATAQPPLTPAAPPVKATTPPRPAATPEPQETAENTVRVPVKRLDQLNDLFGELTIERTALNLHVDRLRNLFGTLTRRLGTLEQTNLRLRTTYDKISVQATPTKGSSHSQSSLLNNLPFTNGQPPLDSTSPITSNADTAGFDVLEMDQYSDLHLISQEIMETIVQMQEVTSDIDISLTDTDEAIADLNRTSRQLQTTVTQARMRPLSDLTSRFPRALRDLCLQYGKQVELKLYGAGTLIDRSVLEALADPLMHLLRNSFDHGIESTEKRLEQGKPAQGTIEIRAGYRGNQTLITLSDNGGGINVDKVRAKAVKMGIDADILAVASNKDILDLIFEPGFSTADKVTELSGRGVGLDVVKTNLREIRGDIKVDTEPGQGTTFTLSVPFTLSVVRALIVESKGMQMAIPADAIAEMVLLKPEEILTTAGSPVLNRDGDLIPLIDLGQWLTFQRPRTLVDAESAPVINREAVLLIDRGNQLTAIQIDRCWGEQEVAVRQVEGSIPMPPGFIGCTILGGGQIIPLVDSNKLLDWIENRDRPSYQPLEYGTASLLESEPMPASFSDNEMPVNRPSITNTILVVDDSVNVRRFLALTLEKAGYRVEQAKDGQDAVEKLEAGLQVQAVICDIEMPRLDGYGVLARIKGNPAFKSLPISMLTSRGGDKHRQVAMNLGASAYFTKPYKEQELLQQLEQLIQNQPLSAVR
jgi:two-component system, chemotaxis family, sensor histidine kinase and response regulator PixL